MLKISLIAGLVTLSSIFTPYALAANLVSNGGFENGLNDWDTNFGFVPSSVSANSGTGSAQVILSSVSGGCCARISQVLPTMNDTEYHLSFFLNFQRGRFGGGLVNNGLVVQIDEIVILNLVNKETNGYEQFSFNFTVSKRRFADPSSVLSFNNAFVNNGFTSFLDDVSVTEVTPVPFEFSPALGIGVLGGLFAAKKLSKKLLKR